MGFFWLVISSKGIEVDKGKIYIMHCLSPLTTIREVRSYLGHVGFDSWFINFKNCKNTMYSTPKRSLIHIFHLYLMKTIRKHLKS